MILDPYINMIDCGPRRIKCHDKDSYALFEVFTDGVDVEVTVSDWEELVLLAYETLMAAEGIYMESKDLVREEAEEQKDFRAIDDAIDALTPLVNKIRALRKARWFRTMQKMRRGANAQQEV